MTKYKALTGSAVKGLMFWTKVFKSLRVPQVRDRRVSVADLPESYHSRIAMVGCGPASISCATYLARLGYTDITIFEKRQYVGGLRYCNRTIIPSL